MVSIDWQCPKDKISTPKMCFRAHKFKLDSVTQENAWLPWVYHALYMENIGGGSSICEQAAMWKNTQLYWNGLEIHLKVTNNSWYVLYKVLEPFTQ